MIDEGGHAERVVGFDRRKPGKAHPDGDEGNVSERFEELAVFQRFEKAADGACGDNQALGSAFMPGSPGEAVNFVEGVLVPVRRPQGPADIGFQRNPGVLREIGKPLAYEGLIAAFYLVD
ncbi:MAG: hypothetical protein BWY66_00121 [bacterium ADurb.Bin374]|nr:MAG: hypothetical protein BWY66_00121 [bacterium ADurb.Bin374]